jgi:nucleoside-diphosphate-sugar epimerase
MSESSSPPPEAPSELSIELSPDRYVERIDLYTGEPTPGVKPQELLVHAHRDHHVMDVQARSLIGWWVERTGEAWTVWRRMEGLRRLGVRTFRALGVVIGKERAEYLGRWIFGLRQKRYGYRFRQPPLSDAERHQVLAALRAAGEERLAPVREQGALKVLLTGGTGFLGQEILHQMAAFDAVAEVVALIRPKRGKPAQERGEELLDRLGIEGAARDRFRFLAGDVETPGLGIGKRETARLQRALTHVIHCAASVSFDAPYEESFQANVLGSLNVLRFSRGLHRAPGSPFVAHLAIETSYIHGRQPWRLAREGKIVFPRDYYNNYYELTKAMASLEAERFQVEQRLPLVQLCPSIVIGDARTGNNRGDTKVINAPINIFGRARHAMERQQELKGKKAGWQERSKTRLMTKIAWTFPGNPSAELNLIPVDRVAAGILAALLRPAAIGRRIHLATDRRLTSDALRRIAEEELEIQVTLTEPTLHRNVRMPITRRVLNRMNQERAATGLSKLSHIFGGYSEWGQPIHEVGNDVELLGLPVPRPNTTHAFRMLCRHNRFLQRFGRIREPGEVARRENLWSAILTEIETDLGKPAASLPADEFRRELKRRLALDTFERVE